MLSALFRTDADNSIGFGHLNRCLVLAEVLKKSGGKAELLIRSSDENVKSIINRRGFVCHMLPQNLEFQSELSSWDIFSFDDFSTIILDMIHPKTLSNLEDFAIFIRKISSRVKKLVLIDSCGKEAVVHQVPDLYADMVIAPYTGVSLPSHSVPYRLLAGPEFCILNREYRNTSLRVTKNSAERIFITCGGSDPLGISLKALAAVEMIKDRKLKIRIAIGPFFKVSLKSQIISLSKKSYHWVNVLDTPSNLAEHYKWCDLVIATSGLTKYELAATGTPAVLLSINREHAEVNLPFALEGTALDLGVHETISVKYLAEQVRMLLYDIQKRRTMAEKGQRLIDGRGADRVIKEIERLSDVKNRI